MYWRNAYNIHTCVSGLYPGCGPVGSVQSCCSICLCNNSRLILISFRSLTRRVVLNWHAGPANGPTQTQRQYPNSDVDMIIIPLLWQPLEHDIACTSCTYKFNSTINIQKTTLEFGSVFGFLALLDKCLLTCSDFVCKPVSGDAVLSIFQCSEFIRLVKSFRFRMVECIQTPKIQLYTTICS